MDDQHEDEIDDLSSEQSEDGVEVHSGESGTDDNDDASNVETPRESLNEYESRDGTVKWDKAPMSVSQGRKAAHNIVKVRIINSEGHARKTYGYVAIVFR